MSEVQLQLPFKLLKINTAPTFVNDEIRIYIVDLDTEQILVDKIITDEWFDVAVVVGQYLSIRTISPNSVYNEFKINTAKCGMVHINPEPETNYGPN